MLCPGRDVRWSTAALLSARFPWVSPSGSIGKEDCGAPSQHTEIGDGGYHETSAASPINELMAPLQELLAREKACAVPLFLQIDNGYAGASSSAEDSAVGQISAPITGAKNAERLDCCSPPAGVASHLPGFVEGDEKDSTGYLPVDRWFHIETRAHPGAQAPLGWVLSKTARTNCGTNSLSTSRRSSGYGGYSTARQISGALPGPKLRRAHDRRIPGLADLDDKVFEDAPSDVLRATAEKVVQFEADSEKKQAVVQAVVDALDKEQREAFVDSSIPQNSGDRKAVYITGFVVATILALGLAAIAWAAADTGNEGVGTAAIAAALLLPSAIIAGLLGRYAGRVRCGETKRVHRQAEVKTVPFRARSAQNQPSGTMPDSGTSSSSVRRHEVRVAVLELGRCR